MILVFGSCIVDFSIAVPRLPAVGETVIGRDLVINFGGKGANQAIALKRLGAEVGLVSSLGNDLWGRSFFDVLVAEGVNVEAVFLLEGSVTGIGVPMVLDQGENAIVVAPSAAFDLAVEAASEPIDAAGTAEAVLLQLEGPLDVYREVIKVAKAASVPVIVNPAPWREEARDICAQADVLIPNQAEAEAITGESLRDMDDAFRAALLLRDLGPRLVVLTLGEKGSIAVMDGDRYFCPAVKVDAVDTTAAGDAFCAGFTYQWTRHQVLPEALEYASACGAVACLKRGASSSLPAYWEVEAYRNRSRVKRDDLTTEEKKSGEA